MHDLILIALQRIKDMSSKLHQSMLFRWMFRPDEAQTSKDKATGDDTDRCNQDKSRKKQIHGGSSLV